MCLVQVLVFAVAWALTSRFVTTAERLWDAEEYFWGYDSPMFQWLSGYRSWGLWLLAVPIVVAVLCRFLTVTHWDIEIVGNGGFYIAALVTVLALAFAVFVVYASSQHAFGGRMRTHPAG